MTADKTLSFISDGARLFKGAVGRRLSDLEVALASAPADAAGTRIQGIEVLRPMLAVQGCIGEVAAAVVGAEAKPVRAILFNKSPATNWSLAWHQDRTICVQQRRAAPGFGPWTIKSGMHHVAPPFNLLASMVTLRVHLDDVPEKNGPLLIAPGSHALGIVPVSCVEDVARRCGTYACLAEAGDVWLYATPILHASKASEAPTNRRVLQVDYAVDALPFGLEWLGV